MRKKRPYHFVTDVGIVETRHMDYFTNQLKKTIYMNYTHFNDEVEHEEAPETWFVHALWLAPLVLLVGFIIVRMII